MRDSSPLRHRSPVPRCCRGPTPFVAKCDVPEQGLALRLVRYAGTNAARQAMLLSGRLLVVDLPQQILSAKHNLRRIKPMPARDRADTLAPRTALRDNRRFTSGGQSVACQHRVNISNRCAPLLTGSSPGIIIVAAPRPISGRKLNAARQCARWGRDCAYEASAVPDTDLPTGEKPEPKSAAASRFQRVFLARASNMTCRGPEICPCCACDAPDGREPHGAAAHRDQGHGVAECAVQICVPSLERNGINVSANFCDLANLPRR